MPSTDHQRKRTVLRILGAVALVAGLALTAMGAYSFLTFEPQLSPSDPGPAFPPDFWMAVVGLPLLAAGGALLMWGYMGEITGYQATELSPAIETGSQALGRGLSSGMQPVACPDCGEENAADARYCDGCGTALARTCAECGDLNDPDARYCDACGAKLG